jgi:hypothetical protein
VLKPGGLSLHIFPPRWKPIEPHVYVPFAGVYRERWWLRLWAELGVRNEFQAGLPAREVAGLNREYLTHRTNYLSTSELQRHFRRMFGHFQFAEDVFLKHSASSRARTLHKVLRFVPPLRGAYSASRQRVIVAIKNGAAQGT